MLAFKSGDHEVNYDLQIFADRIEFCWIHLRGIGALENSLWAYDGQGIRVWLSALSIEAPMQDNSSNPPDNVKESVNIPLDFYPLCRLTCTLYLACLIFSFASCTHGQRHYHWSRT